MEIFYFYLLPFFTQAVEKTITLFFCDEVRSQIKSRSYTPLSVLCFFFFFWLMLVLVTTDCIHLP